MAKVDWINWKTNPNDIIDPEQIKEELDKKIKEYEKSMQFGVYDTIEEEMSSGGLNKTSLNIFGSSPAHDKANEILKKIDDIKQKMESVKKQIYQEAIKQREIEKQQLISCLEEKIVSEEKVLDMMMKLSEKAENNQTLLDYDEIENIMKDTVEKITNLNERLKIAKEI
jgi:hypothetical protein